nr:MAG TPA: hypothetical protein [Caudoviricetes sp.]
MVFFKILGIIEPTIALRGSYLRSKRVYGITW